MTKRNGKLPPLHFKSTTKSQELRDLYDSVGSQSISQTSRPSSQTQFSQIDEDLQHQTNSKADLSKSNVSMNAINVGQIF